MAHVCVENLRLTAENGAATGLSLEDLGGKISCESCKIGKATKNPNHRIMEPENTEPGKIVHTDLSGPFTETISGKKYLMVALDQGSRFVMLYFLRRKSESAEKIKEFIAFMEARTGNRVHTLRTDGAREYLTNEFRQYLTDSGIMHGLSPPRSPAQNGRIERQMRRIKELATTMLTVKNLPRRMWAGACAFAVYILNRTVNKAMPTKTPY